MADEPIYAVLVDPTAVLVGKVALYRALRDGLAKLGRKPAPAEWADLVARLEAGPTTVAQGLTRAEARTLAEWLAAHAIDAKLRRTATSPRPDFPPRPERPPSGLKPAPPPAVPKLGEPGELPPLEKPPPKHRATRMEGWALSLAPTGEMKEVQRDTVVDPPREPVETTGEQAVLAAPGILGWQQVVPSGAPGRSPKASPFVVAEAPMPAGRVPAPAPKPAALGSPPIRGAAPPPPLGSRGQPTAAGPTAPSAPEAEPKPTAGAAPAIPAAAALEPARPRTAPAPPAAAPPPLRPPAALDELPGRPIPLHELRPLPAMALALGVAAPGAGEIYLGRTDVVRRVTLVAPLIVPWVRSAKNAHREAVQVASSKRPPRTRPRPIAAWLFVLGFWLAVGALAWGAAAVYGALARPTGPQSALQPTPQPPAATETTAVAPGSGELSAEVARRQVQARARALFRDATEACQLNAWARCVELSDQARQLDPELQQAARLYHMATLQLEQSRSTCEGSGAGDCP